MKVDANENIVRTKCEAEILHYVTEAIRRVEYDQLTPLLRQRRIPFEREENHNERCYHKTRMPMRTDRGVLKFFRLLGLGHQPRMNDVTAGTTPVLQGSERLQNAPPKIRRIFFSEPNGEYGMNPKIRAIHKSRFR